MNKFKIILAFIPYMKLKEKWPSEKVVTTSSVLIITQWLNEMKTLINLVALLITIIAIALFIVIQKVVM